MKSSISSMVSPVKNKYKVALLSINLNQPYWVYEKSMLDSARQFFLKGHEIDFHVWTDMPEDADLGANVFKYPTEPFEWPLPTLFRYSLFLQQEELLKDYDYLFYCDADMLFVSPVGDEILGGGLTMAQHPMYAVNRLYVPPYDPNPESTANIKMSGRIVEKNNKKQFEPLYAAGGFQGGTTDSFIKAMKVMKSNIDKDFSKNYIAIWNDESHWNRYLYDNPPSVVLSPSYVYPDSLTNSYYVKKVWGRNYVPKIVTLTKPFTLSKEGGTHLQTIL